MRVKKKKGGKAIASDLYRCEGGDLGSEVCAFVVCGLCVNAPMSRYVTVCCGEGLCAIQRRGVGNIDA